MMNPTNTISETARPSERKDDRYWVKLHAMTPSPTAKRMIKQLTALMFLVLMFMVTDNQAQSTIDAKLRTQMAVSVDSDVFKVTTRSEKLDPQKTAIIVCDTWDYHHCLNAVRRLEEFAPRMNEVLIDARKRGVTIIHAPSDCMDAYKNHPARKRATNATKAEFQPHGIADWCSVIPSEERATYPIDQSDGGEDDDP